MFCCGLREPCFVLKVNTVVKSKGARLLVDIIGQPYVGSFRLMRSKIPPLFHPNLKITPIGVYVHGSRKHFTVNGGMPRAGTPDWARQTVADDLVERMTNRYGLRLDQDVVDTLSRSVKLRNPCYGLANRPSINCSAVYGGGYIFNEASISEGLPTSFASLSPKRTVENKCS